MKEWKGPWEDRWVDGRKLDKKCGQRHPLWRLGCQSASLSMVCNALDSSMAELSDPKGTKLLQAPLKQPCCTVWAPLSPEEPENLFLSG